MINIKRGHSVFKPKLNSGMRNTKSLILIFLVASALVLGTLGISCSPRKILLTYSNDFVTNLNKEVKAWDNFSTDYEKADFLTDNGRSSLQKLLPNHLQVFNNFLLSYQKECPANAPQELKDAVNNAKEGTSNIIAGITVINTGLTNNSIEQGVSGENMLNDGLNLLKQSSTNYNSYADAANAKLRSGSSNFGPGILIGTGIVWFSILVIINPLSKYLTKRKSTYQTVNGFQVQTGQEISQIADGSSTRNYVIIGVITFAIIGFVVGRTTGWYFIGISWKPKDWPGMLAFIGFSLLGSYLY
jgi:tetrahydromethanopterin S-methyltransferase subunit B